MNAQSPQWILGTSLINFQNTLVPVLMTSSLPQQNLIRVSNAAFDSNGALLFYVRGSSIYDRNNVFVQEILTPISFLSKEICIVNVPGTCNQFYIIGMTETPLCHGCTNSLQYVKVTVNASSISLSPAEHLTYSGQRSFAISKLRQNKTRYLFVVGNSVERFLINRNGITHQQTLLTNTANDPSDVELYENPATGNMRLAYGNGISGLNIHNLDNNGNFINNISHVIPGIKTVSGVEFIDSNRIIIAQDNTNSGNKGIVLYNALFQSAQFIPNTMAYHNSYIEKAVDGKFYVTKEHIVSNVNQGYKLASINTSAMTVTEVPNITLPNIDKPFYQNIRVLPDQIDNENYAHANYRWDLAAFDNAADTGAEPYIPSPGNEVIWESNDIWNRKTVNGLSVIHQNPGYSSDPSRYNVMRFRVRNIGCTESTESRVRLYWTMGATGESWDNNTVPVNPPSPTALNSWDGSKCIINPQTSTCIPAGGELKSKSLVFNSNAPDYDSSNPSTPGFIVPPLQPGQEIIIDAKWQPVNPSLFGDPNVISNPVLCFLGRIVNVNDPMYSELPASTTNMMGDNVKNNNNIVTRNTSLVPLGVSEGTYYQYDSSIFIGNPTSTQTDFIVRFDRTMVNDNSFSNIGRIKIKLDDRLWEKWKAAGAEGKGVEIFNAEKHEIEVTNFDNAQLANISLEPGEYRAIKFTFELKQPTDLIQDYQYTVSQVSTEKPDQHYGSACVFNVKINHTQETGESFYEEMAKTSPSNTHSNFKGISIAPNPSSDFAKLDFELSQNNLINIQVFDLLGKIVKSIESNKNFSKGLNNVKFSTSDLPSGSYFVVIAAPEERISVQLVIKH